MYPPPHRCRLVNAYESKGTARHTVDSFSYRLFCPELFNVSLNELTRGPRGIACALALVADPGRSAKQRGVDVRSNIDRPTDCPSRLTFSANAGLHEEILEVNESEFVATQMLVQRAMERVKRVNARMDAAEQEVRKKEEVRREMAHPGETLTIQGSHFTIQGPHFTGPPVPIAARVHSTPQRDSYDIYKVEKEEKNKKQSARVLGF
eukprot:1195964-Prorocentrum_minimum.AAC.9